MDTGNKNTNNLLSSEIKIMNDFRKLTQEQRNEIINIIKEEEQKEEEELKKNPNLNLEKNLKIILENLKELRNEIKNIKNKIQNDKTKYNLSDTNLCNMENNLELESYDYELCNYSNWYLIIVSIILVAYLLIEQNFNRKY